MVQKLMVLLLIIMVLFDNANASDKATAASCVTLDPAEQETCIAMGHCTFFINDDANSCVPVCEKLDVDECNAHVATDFCRVSAAGACENNCDASNGLDTETCNFQEHCSVDPTSLDANYPTNDVVDCVPSCEGFKDVEKCKAQNHCVAVSDFPNFEFGHCINKPTTCYEYVTTLHTDIEGVTCTDDSTPCWGKHCETECCFTQCLDYTNGMVRPGELMPPANCKPVDDAARLYCNNGENCESLCCKCSSHSNKNTCDNAARSCHFASDTCKEGEDSSKPAAIKNVIIDADKVEVEFEGEDSNRRLSEENSLAGRRKRE